MEYALPTIAVMAGLGAWLLYASSVGEGGLLGAFVDWIRVDLESLSLLPFREYFFPQDFQNILGATGNPHLDVPLFSYKIAGAILLVALAIFLPLYLNFSGVCEQLKRRETQLALALFFIPVLLMLVFSWLVKPVFYSPRSSMFVLPYFVLSLTVLVGLIPRATIAGGVAVCLTSTWIFSSIEVMGTQQKDNITERFDSAFFGSEVDLSITSHVDTQAFYAYNLPPEARLLKREKLEKHLPDFDRRFAHVAVFAVRDRRRPFSNWPEDPVMERLLSASTQTERIVQTPGTNVYLLRVSLAEWERRSP